MIPYTISSGLDSLIFLWWLTGQIWEDLRKLKQPKQSHTHYICISFGDFSISSEGKYVFVWAVFCCFINWTLLNVVENCNDSFSATAGQTEEQNGNIQFSTSCWKLITFDHCHRHFTISLTVEKLLFTRLRSMTNNRVKTENKSRFNIRELKASG